MNKNTCRCWHAQLAVLSILFFASKFDLCVSEHRSLEILLKNLGRRDHSRRPGVKVSLAGRHGLSQAGVSLLVAAHMGVSVRRMGWGWTCLWVSLRLGTGACLIVLLGRRSFCFSMAGHQR